MDSLHSIRSKLFPFIGYGLSMTNEKPMTMTTATTVLETVTKFTTTRSTVDIVTTSTSTITQPMTVTSTATVVATATATSVKSVPLVIAGIGIPITVLRTAFTVLLSFVFLILPVAVLGYHVRTSMRTATAPAQVGRIAPSANSLRNLNFAIVLFIPCGLLILHPSLSVNFAAIAACVMLTIFLTTLFGITELALHFWATLKTSCRDWFNADGWTYQPGWSKVMPSSSSPLQSSLQEIVSPKYMTTEQKMERQSQLVTQLGGIISSYTPEERKQMKVRMVREWCLIGEDENGGRAPPFRDTLALRGTQGDTGGGWPWQVDRALAGAHAFDHGCMFVPEGSGDGWPRLG